MSFINVVTKLYIWLEDEKSCLFYVGPNLRIYEGIITKWSSYPYFTIAARNDAVPLITLDRVKHCENEDNVQIFDAWQAVLQTLIYSKDKLKLIKLPLNHIYVNLEK